MTGLYEPDTWGRLPVIEGGDPGWDDVVAIPVRVTKPGQPPTIAQLGIAWPPAIQTAETFPETSEAPVIQLLGATPERKVIRENDTFRLAIFWEALTTPVIDYQIRLQLLTSDGTILLEETGQPSHSRYPTTAWSAGERVRDNHALWIPAGIPAGIYRLQVQLLNQTGQPAGKWVELGQLKVNEPG